MSLISYSFFVTKKLLIDKNSIMNVLSSLCKIGCSNTWTKKKKHELTCVWWYLSRSQLILGVSLLVLYQIYEISHVSFLVDDWSDIYVMIMYAWWSLLTAKKKKKKNLWLPRIECGPQSIWLENYIRIVRMRKVSKKC